MGRKQEEKKADGLSNGQKRAVTSGEKERERKGWRSGGAGRSCQQAFK